MFFYRPKNIYFTTNNSLAGISEVVVYIIAIGKRDRGLVYAKSEERR